MSAGTKRNETEPCAASAAQGSWFVNLGVGRPPQLSGCYFFFFPYTSPGRKNRRYQKTAEGPKLKIIGIIVGRNRHDQH